MDGAGAGRAEGMVVAGAFEDVEVGVVPTSASDDRRPSSPLIIEPTAIRLPHRGHENWSYRVRNTTSPSAPQLSHKNGVANFMVLQGWWWPSRKCIKPKGRKQPTETAETTAAVPTAWKGQSRPRPANQRFVVVAVAVAGPLREFHYVLIIRHT